MQIGSVGALHSYASITQNSRPEAAERGPDHDHDSDDGAQAAPSSSQPAPAAGRGVSVDIKA